MAQNGSKASVAQNGRAQTWLAQGLVLLLTACLKSAPPPTPDAGAPSPAVDASMALEPTEALPARDAYAGSTACRDCHLERYEAWRTDWHARAMSEPSKETVVGRFTGQHFKGESTEATMFTRGSRWVMRTADRQGTTTDYPLSYVIGGKRMQDAVTTFPDGRWQVLPVYFHVTGKGEWVDYNAAKQGRVTAEHPFFWTNFRRTANRECIACHATGWDVRYSRADHRWTTDAEPGVGCEACHGPGARHAESKAAADIIAFSKLTAAQAMAICASCHGPREPLFPFLDRAHRFTPGLAYDATFQPSGLIDGENRSGEFFVDGRPSSSSFEWQALQQSRCFRVGQATCATCHTSPHDPHGPNELKPSSAAAVDPDQSCRSCHAAEAGAAAEHSHHATAEGQRCVGCHMPRTVTGVLDTFADHAIDVPVPENTLEHGIPNACGVCHPQKTPAALLASTQAWWPNSLRRVRRVRLAAAFDEKTKQSSAESLVVVVRDQTEAPLVRGFAAELLGQRFPARAAEVLPAQLEASDAYLRSRVLAGLSSARAKGAATAVAAHLTDASVVVREFAALLLTTWGDPRGVPALERLTTEASTRTLVRPHLALAQRLAGAGQVERAHAHVRAALEVMPYAASALVLEADLAMRQNDVAAASAALQEALAFDPGNAAATQRLSSLGAH